MTVATINNVDPVTAAISTLVPNAPSRPNRTFLRRIRAASERQCNAVRLGAPTACRCEYIDGGPEWVRCNVEICDRNADTLSWFRPPKRSLAYEPRTTTHMMARIPRTTTVTLRACLWYVVTVLVAYAKLVDTDGRVGWERVPSRPQPLHDDHHLKMTTVKQMLRIYYRIVTFASRRSPERA